MANIKSNDKSKKQDDKRNLRNKALISEIKTAMKKAENVQTEAAVNEAVKLIDKAVTSGVFHKNKSARLKSSMHSIDATTKGVKKVVKPTPKKVEKKPIAKPTPKKVEEKPMVKPPIKKEESVSSELNPKTGEHIVHEYVVKEHVVKEHMVKDHVVKEHVVKEHVTNPKNSDKEVLVKEHVVKEHEVKEHVVKEHPVKEYTVKEHIAKNPSPRKKSTEEKEPKKPIESKDSNEVDHATIIVDGLVNESENQEISIESHSSTIDNTDHHIKEPKEK